MSNLEKDNVTFVSMFDAYVAIIDNRQRQYAINMLRQLERQFRDSGQADAADTTRSFAAVIVADLFEHLLTLKDEMEKEENAR